MGRNNERNIKKHNDKLHQAQAKVKSAKLLRQEKLQAIIKKYNEQDSATSDKKENNGG